jgi:hypothetical protein
MSTLTLLYWEPRSPASSDAPIIDEITLKIAYSLERGRFIGKLSLDPKYGQRRCGCNLEGTNTNMLELHEVTLSDNKTVVLTHLAAHYAAYHRWQFDEDDWVLLRRLPSLNDVSDAEKKGVEKRLRAFSEKPPKNS